MFFLPTRFGITTHCSGGKITLHLQSFGGLETLAFVKSISDLIRI
jgi:hypothetical protein